MTNPRVALYGSGLFNQTDPSPPYAEQISQLTTGGFTTVLLWSIHVHENGDFYYNDTLMVSGGVLQLGSDFTENVNALVAGGVKEILLSVGAWGGTSDFVNLQATWNTAGAKNLQALSAAFPVTAVDFDYESQTGYTTPEAAMIIDLTLKVSSLGVGVTYCPYMDIPFWMQCLQQSYQQSGSVQPVRWLNLQCYAGGAGNDPRDWVTAVNNANAGIADAGAFVVPGYWVAGDQGSMCPSQLQSTFEGLRGSGITGGFLWNSGDLFQYESASSPSCQGAATYPVDYANAIVNGLGGQSRSTSPSATTSNTFTVSVPAGPIWSNDDAQTKAPIVAAAHGGKWNGQWRTVVGSMMSTVDVEMPAPAGGGGVNFTMDVPAGPIWNNDDAQIKGPIVAASYNGTWNGQWTTIVEGQMSVIGVTFNW